MAEDADAQKPAVVELELADEERRARQEAMDKLVPAIDPSDYGKMPPSFHRNSQRVAPVTVETEIWEDVANGESDNMSASTRSRPIRAPILPRDKFDGVDSDDETDEENTADDEDEDEHPQVVGEVEIDMADEEDEFLEFARQALGVSDEQWKSIIEERKERGGMCT